MYATGLMWDSGDMRLEDEMKLLVPVKVTAIEANEPFFVIFFGQAASLSVNCEWTLTDLKGARTRSEDVAIDDFPEVVGTLVDLTLVGFQVDEDLVDPLLTFDEGVTLQIRADSDLDPWVLTHDGFAVAVGRRA